MNFLLKETMFETILSFFIIINIITGVIFSILIFIKETKKDLKILKVDKNIATYKIIIMIIWGTIFTFLSIININKNALFALALIIILLYYLKYLFKINKKNINELTFDQKNNLVLATYPYIIFFSSAATKIWLSSFSTFDHLSKEYLLLFFITIKFIYLITALLINIAIILSNIKYIFNKAINKLNKLINQFLKKEFELKFYNFKLSNNRTNKKSLIFDKIIFAVICPFYMIIIIFEELFISFIRYLLKTIIKINNKINNLINNSSSIITTIIKISSIVTLMGICVFTIYNPSIINVKTKETYNLFATIILIPLIYDRIKNYK